MTARPQRQFPNCLDLWGIDLNDFEFREPSPEEIKAEKAAREKAKWDKAAKHAEKLRLKRLRKRRNQRRYLEKHPDAVPMPGCLVKRPVKPGTALGQREAMPQ